MDRAAYSHCVTGYERGKLKKKSSLLQNVVPHVSMQANWNKLWKFSFSRFASVRLFLFSLRSHKCLFNILPFVEHFNMRLHFNWTTDADQ